MDIAIAGSSGLIGKALVHYFTNEGHTIHPLKRGASGEYEPLIEGSDVVINLAGAPISGRWSKRYMQEILESRVSSTRILAEKAARMENPPKVFINASAIGYYGDRGEQTVDEKSAPGQGFLSEVAMKWEDALSPLQNSGVRTVAIRTGVVLSTKGGALARMLPPFKLGLGGRIGTGRQFMSWIALDDVVGAIDHIIANDSLAGPVNLVAPFAVRNAEFTKALGEALHRPTLFPMPAFAVRLLFGKMGEELLLSGAKVEPAKLLATGYPFLYPKLSECFYALLSRP